MNKNENMQDLFENPSTIQALQLSPEIMQILNSLISGEKDLIYDDIPIEELKILFLFALFYKNDHFVQWWVLEKENEVNFLKSGCTPLMVAVVAGEKKNVEILIKAGARIDVKGSTGMNPLLLASKLGSLEVCRVLLDYGASVDSKDDDQWTALLYAVTRGEMDVVGLLLDYGADISHTVRNDWCPLIAASSGGHVDIVQFLLDRGADIEQNTLDGWTALLAASQSGKVDVVKVLIKNGANLDHEENQNWTALMHASLEGNAEVCKELIFNGAEVNYQDPEGWTALISASQNGHLLIVQMLIENGAKIDHQESVDSWTALSFASRNLKHPVVEFLSSKGANVNHRTKSGHTPLMFAAKSGSLSIVECLLQYGADPTLLTEKNKKAGYFAKKNDHEEIVELLDGISLLSKYLISGSFQKIKEILSTVSSMLSFSVKNQSVLQYVVSSYNQILAEKIITLLLDKGVSIFSTAFDEKYAFEISLERNYTRCAEILIGGQESLLLYQIFSERRLEILRLLASRFNVLPNRNYYVSEFNRSEYYQINADQLCDLVFLEIEGLNQDVDISLIQFPARKIQEIVEISQEYESGELYHNSIQPFFLSEIETSNLITLITNVQHQRQRYIQRQTPMSQENFLIFPEPHKYPMITTDFIHQYNLEKITYSSPKKRRREEKLDMILKKLRTLEAKVTSLENMVHF